MKKHIWRLIIYGALSSVILFYIYGRSIWSPIKNKILAKKSIAEVNANLSIRHHDFWQKILKEKELIDKTFILYLIALKNERQLEVWAKTPNRGTQLNSFPFTGYSGQLGPKLREGDGQIPEGIYKVNSLNPNSAYHLSIKLNYPNSYDRQAAKAHGRTNLGSNIFIHGNSLSIGCIPIGDENIEKLFFLVNKVSIEKTMVLIAPNDLRIKQAPNNKQNPYWIREKYKRLTHEMNAFPKKD
jgi:murein L,D-transpeptidase YafK